MNIKKFLQNEKNVEMLEKIDQHLKLLVSSQKDMGFVRPLLFLIIERLRTTDTSFPSFMFRNPNKK